MPTEDWKYQVSLALPESTPDATLSALYDIVEAALKGRDERAAEICDYYSEEDGDIASQAAAAIRNEDTNA